MFGVTQMEVHAWCFGDQDIQKAANRLFEVIRKRLYADQYRIGPVRLQKEMQLCLDISSKFRYWQYFGICFGGKDHIKADA